MNAESDEALREAAAEWFARMRAPDAERDRPAFEAWLGEDVRHKRAYDRMLVTWEQSRLVTHTPVGEAYEGLQKRERPRRPPWGYAVAAGIAALLVLGLLLAPRGLPTGPQAAPQEIASEIGIRKVRLRDGSIVTLDAGTRLVLHLAGNKRRVELKAGRARFEVAQDPARTFVVSAGGREVVATGTTFDVCLVAGRIEIALLKGGVDVRNMGGAGGPAPVLVHLNSGQSLALEPGAAQAMPKPSTPSELDWVSGMIGFDGTPLRDVVTIANRYSARRLALGDPTLGDLKVTGGFKVGDPQTLAAALSAAFGLEVRRQGRDVVLLDRIGPGKPRSVR